MVHLSFWVEFRPVSFMFIFSFVSVWILSLDEPAPDPARLAGVGRHPCRSPRALRGATARRQEPIEWPFS